MGVGKNSTLKEVREDILRDDSDFFKRVKSVYDEVHNNKDERRFLSFVMAVLLGGVSSVGASKKYYDIYLGDKPDTMWRNDCGYVIYYNNREAQYAFGNENDAIKRIDENRKVSDLEEIVKDCFNKNDFPNSNIDNPYVLKYMNNICDKLFLGTKSISLATLQQEMLDAEKNNTKTKFVEWALNRAKNREDGAFWFFMAMILGGANNLNKNHPTGDNIIMANVAFIKLAFGTDNDFNWYAVNNKFTENNQRSKDSDFENQNSKLIENRKSKKGGTITLTDLRNYIDASINDKTKTLPGKIDYTLYELFNPNVGSLKDKLTEVLKNCDELIAQLKNDQGVSMNDSDQKYDIVDIVESNIVNNDQVIFTGAPGTGKTYSVLNYVKNEHYKFVQFHPSYDYSDFIEGLRPVDISVNANTTANPTFVRIDGVFKKFCREIVESNLESIFVNWKNFNDKEKSNLLEFMYFARKYKRITNQLMELIDNPDLFKKIKGIYEVAISMNSDNELSSSESSENEIINQNTMEESKEFIAHDQKNRIANSINNSIKLILDDKNIDLSINESYALEYHYFVVDEVNRADLSKVFGEIMFALEESYRGIENRFDTQYMNLKTYEIDSAGKAIRMSFDCFEKGFFIPFNLKFIGTMNDIDRSVESFDFALRRRFHWVNIKANDIMHKSLQVILSKKPISPDIVSNLADCIREMNSNVISGDLGKKLGLDENYHIGPAYFKSFDGRTETLERIFDSNIESTIREYTRGRQRDSVNELIVKCREALGL